ncbi:MAG: hypothetical protein ABFR82_13655 [Nitrospirota bacterium]
MCLFKGKIEIGAETFDVDILGGKFYASNAEDRTISVISIAEGRVRKR